MPRTERAFEPRHAHLLEHGKLRMLGLLSRGAQLMAAVRAPPGLLRGVSIWNVLLMFPTVLHLLQTVLLRGDN